MKEIEKLINLLTKNNIPFQVDQSYNPCHIAYPCFGENMICSVIRYDFGPYLEIMGLVDDEAYEFKEEPVEGFLIADEAFVKIQKYHLCKNKEAEYKQVSYSGRKVYVKNTHRKELYISDEAEESIKKSIEFLDVFSLRLKEADLWKKYNDVTDAIYALKNLLEEKENVFNKEKENQI